MRDGQLSEQQRRHRTATSKAMKRVAESRRCPKCERGMALRSSKDAVMRVTTCRYCDFERAAWRD